MLTENKLSPKQQAATDRLFAYDETILVAPTGAGKTVICLTAIKELIAEKHLHRVIVACPAKVVSVWKKEQCKWDHLENIGVTLLEGSAAERTRRMNYMHDVIVVSLNNLEWLLAQDHGADGIIIDELSKASGKQAAGLRSKKKADCFIWRVGMTATPVSQDFQKLYSMARIIDRGQALGTNKEKYLNQFFYSDYMGYNWTLRDGAEAQIMARVKGLVHLIDDTKAEDLPACHEHVIRFEMPDSTREVYNQMKKDMVAGDVEAVNEAVKSGKLRQIASGFMYDENGVWRTWGDEVRACRAALWASFDRKGVIFYEYVQQLNNLRHNIRNTTEDIGEFINSKDNLKLLAQVNSLSHGVDGLQHVCSDVLFYHPMWSRDATEQAIGRVWRQGQENEVNVTTLVCENTLDDLVMSRVEDRGLFMKMFVQHLKSEG